MIGQESAEVIVVARTLPPAIRQLETSRDREPEALPAEGPNLKREEAPISFHDTHEPDRGSARVAVITSRSRSKPAGADTLPGEYARAWKRVKANKGAPGIDEMPIDDFLAFAREHWEEIRSSLQAGTYQPLPVQRVEIPKPTGGTRPLGIPTVLDRLIQQAIAQVLLPIFDPHFSEASFGFRPGRSAHGAVHRVRDYIRKGYRVAVDADLSKFFDTVDHDVLMTSGCQKGAR